MDLLSLLDVKRIRPCQSVEASLCLAEHAETWSWTDEDAPEGLQMTM
jgi:hypothetical protein